MKLPKGTAYERSFAFLLEESATSSKAETPSGADSGRFKKSPERRNFKKASFKKIPCFFEFQ